MRQPKSKIAELERRIAELERREAFRPVLMQQYPVYIPVQYPIYPLYQPYRQGWQQGTTIHGNNTYGGVPGSSVNTQAGGGGNSLLGLALSQGGGGQSQRGTTINSPE